MQPLPGKRGKDEDQEEVSIFQNITKSTTLLEARKYFNQAQIDPVKCARTLTKFIWLLMHDEDLVKEEATEVFFGVTKLWQSQDMHLRRLCYLIIKSLRVSSDESLIVVACLSRDMTSKVDLFRANSIRVLAKIMDNSMIGSVERFLKQSLVDKDPFIVASTLCAAQHLYKVAPDTVKRWTNEVQEAMNSDSKAVQFHALALLYQLRQQDRLAINKTVAGLMKNTPSGPLAQCLLIRVIASILRASATPNAELLKYLEGCLHNRNQMVMYEAAKTICSLESLSATQVAPAIGLLQDFLTQPSSAFKFAAVRTLSEVVVRHPLAVAPCSAGLEQLISDPNRSIATLAITTLLKTGVEANVDRLMKSISGFISEVADEFKIVLVDAIKTLCLKFPHKHATLVAFMSSALREEGGFKYKKALVDALLTVIDAIAEAKELGLEHFCEFIEDCEFAELSIKILNVLGEKGPSTSNPAKYIRYIFNRVILETTSVRAAAVSALARFGTAIPALTDNVVVLLKRCLNDNDDEVRDRAIMYIKLLESDSKRIDDDNSAGRKLAKHLLGLNAKLPNLPQLEASLSAYLDNSSLVSQAPFDITKNLVKIEEKKEKKEDDKPEPQIKKVSVNQDLALLNSIPELAALGTVFKTCTAAPLTEKETEYVVSCIKHILPAHVVFQFTVTNNMEDQQLENVTVEMECEKPGWTEEMTVPEEKLLYQIAGTTFVCFNRPKTSFNSGPIACTLKFTVKEVNGGEVATKGSEEEYQLEEIEVQESDFMRPGENIGLVEFKRQWEQLGETNEVVKKYMLGLDGLQAATEAVVELLGMTPCEGSGSVPEGKNTHAATLTGQFFGGIPVLARAGFMLDQKHGVTLKIAVRSSSPQLNTMLTNAIR